MSVTSALLCNTHKLLVCVCTCDSSDLMNVCVYASYSMYTTCTCITVSLSRTCRAHILVMTDRNKEIVEKEVSGRHPIEPCVQRRIHHCFLVVPQTSQSQIV